MTQPTEKQRQQATTKAAIAVLCLAAFSALFMCLVMGLSSIAASDAQGDDAEPALAFGEQEAWSEPFYVLLIGSDSRRGTALYTGTDNGAQDAQYADIMTLMRVDPATYTITLVSIPRDTVITEDGNKVNSALLSGNPQDVVDEVKTLTGMQADYYMMTTFISFENLVNALGGIDIDVPVTITVPDPANGKSVTVKAGKNKHLDGSQALVLARARHEYGDEQDTLRQVNVRNIEGTLIRKVLDMNGDIDIEHIIAIVEHDTYTNIDLPTAGATILDFVQHADEVTIYECTGPYYGKNRASDDEWVIEADTETWERLMQAVDSGDDPTSIVVAPKFPSKKS